ncbi:MAG: Peptidoglycan hydrolase FlgJ [Halieaceae bacterium]|nr:MAG: Peptidoglycan hydrolase FlgJ [Halieaceae bacterium]
MSDVIFNDIGYLGALRAEASAAPNKALEEVASQFEALFIQQMMKSMRDAIPQGDLMGSEHVDTYQAMADQQMSLNLAEEGGIGLARMLVEQMQTKGYVPNDGRGADANKNDLKTNEPRLPESGGVIDG